ncbi:MAG TPA: cytochrome c biogenesis protein CcsA [Planctomycetota bacterium]|jgi:cytochrome c-type biogenesis protein CcsB
MSALASNAVAGGWLLAGLASYSVTAVVSAAGEISRKAPIKKMGLWLLIAALALNGCAIGSMWMEAGRAPFKTLYETLFLYPFCIALVSLVLVRLHRLSLLVPVAAGGAIVCLLYAYNRPDLEYVELPPALQSAWFVPHVITYFVAYAALFISFCLAGLALLKGRKADPSQPIPLDSAAHKAAVFGFVTLTFGLAMGAAWGKSAWGEYWSWDVKENWAFITWLLYLAYHHVRMLAAWHGRKALWVNMACFAAAMFTYLGMHLLPAASGSLHVYQ